MLADPCHGAPLPLSRLPVPLDLRDHVVLAGAIGLAVGATRPIADGAHDVAALSSAIGAVASRHRVCSAAEIASAPTPFRLTSGFFAWEARLNLCLWRALLAGAAPEALELLARVSGMVGA